MNTRRTQEYYYDQIVSLNRLPTLPLIASELVQITREDSLSINQIMPIVEKDPPFAMMVLKLANSAYYGINREVESLHHALVVIGLKELSQLAVGFSVLRVIAPKDDTGLISWEKLWEHSAAVGHVAQLLQDKLKINFESSPYALGLLHDVGKIVLYQLEPEKYRECLSYAAQERCMSYEAESQILGIDHSTVGGWIAEKWQLPPQLVSAISQHHNPEQNDDGELKIASALIHLSDLVCNAQQLNFGTEFIQVIPKDATCWTILKEVSPSMDDLDFERFVMGIEDELLNIKNLVQLVTGT